MIEKIIDGARFAPSGHNSQSTEYVVVHDRAVMSKISELVIEYFKFECRRLENPIFRTMALLAVKEKTEAGLKEIPGFKRKIKMYEAGADPILHRAPVFIAFHARRNIGYADINAHLALQNASLVAHSLGIGHFFTGWVVAPCVAPMARSWNARLPSLLGIPQRNGIFGALALGYPVPKFKNWINRKPPQIKWV
jgi:nitroreductase